MVRIGPAEILEHEGAEATEASRGPELAVGGGFHIFLSYQVIIGPYVFVVKSVSLGPGNWVAGPAAGNAG